MKHIEEKISQLLEGNAFSNMAVRIGQGNQIKWETYQSSERSLTKHSLFDMASCTKIMVTTPLALLALDRGLIRLSTKVSEFFPVPDDKRDLTIFHLLTHMMGYGHAELFAPDLEYPYVQEKILSIPCNVPVGTKVQYSCPGFILLGRILEQVFGMPLEACFSRLIAQILEMNESTFHPDPQKTVNSNLAEENRGIVNDYNSRYLGGVCGNAGLFSCMNDVGKYVQWLIRHGQPLISEEVFEKAIKNQTLGMNEARGLGFVYVESSYQQTGDLFPNGSIGHCGHTGQSIFLDPATGLYVIILSDMTIHAVKKYGSVPGHYEKVKQMRKELHQAILYDLQDRFIELF